MSSDENQIPETQSVSEEEKITILEKEASIKTEEEAKGSFVSAADLPQKEPKQRKVQTPVPAVQDHPMSVIIKMNTTMIETFKVIAEEVKTNTKAQETSAKAYEKMAVEIELYRKVAEKQLEFFEGLTKNRGQISSPSIQTPSNPQIQPKPPVTAPVQSPPVAPKPSSPAPMPPRTLAPKPAQTAPTQVTASTSTPLTNDQMVENLRMMFPEDIECRLSFDAEKSTNFVFIKPKQFLGSENFAKVSSAVRGKGGAYVSAGPDSHWEIPKANIK